MKIVLGSASKNARPVLDSLKIADYFDAIADGFTYKHGKPHPDVFVTGARMAGAQPAECIVFEDAAAGITAALDGGFVAVGIGRYQSLKHANLFIKSLEDVDCEKLVKLHARCCPATWTVSRSGVDTARENAFHTIFCVGNGRLGVRGRIAELPAGGRQGIYLAGFYDRFSRPAQNTASWSPFHKYWGDASLAEGEQIETTIVNCPNFIDAGWTVSDAAGSEKIDFSTGKLLSLERRLDLRSGLFTADAHWVSPAGRELRLVQRRFASMANTARVLVQYELEPLNFSGTVAFRAGIRTDSANSSETGPQKLYDVLQKETLPNNGAAVLVKGKTDGRLAAFASAVAMVDSPAASYAVGQTDDGIDIVARAAIEQDRILYVERTAAVASDRSPDNPLDAATQTLSAAQILTFNEARIESTARWQELWDNSDIVIEGDPADQMSARYSVYQLLIAASADDPGVSIPAKGLTSEGYRGMVFWDTDIHMTSFFNLTQPAIARNLALFRCRTIDGARRKAAKYGFRGASYPWETGVSGDEECEKWLKLITHQAHITADVAYALQQYVDCTGDLEFYEDHAAEVLVDTARFWISKCVPDGDELSIPDAGGPDEFHVVCDNSAYVNHLAILNLELAERVIRHLQRKAPAKLAEIMKRTGLTDDEIAKISSYPPRIKRMEQPGGLLEQCEGFFGLRQEVVKSGWNTDPFNTQTVKQADVMMLLYLLPDAWPKEAVRANWDYYEPRTIHESSLSHGAHGMVALEIGLLDKAEKYIGQSLGMDLHDQMGNAAGGAHMAAHGLNWSAVVRGYGGSRPQGNMFCVHPHLPKDWRRLAFNIKWRGADFTVDISGGRVSVANKPQAAAALPLLLCGEECTLQPGQSITA